MRKCLWKSARFYTIDECTNLYNRLDSNFNDCWSFYISLPRETTKIVEWQIVPVLLHHIGSNVNYMQYVLVLELEENE